MAKRIVSARPPSSSSNSLHEEAATFPAAQWNSSSTPVEKENGDAIEILRAEEMVEAVVDEPSAPSSMVPPFYECLCPICCSPIVTDPVLLHTEPSLGTSAIAGRCIACLSCAKRWRCLVNAGESRKDGGGAAARLHHTILCPLCSVEVHTSTEALQPFIGKAPQDEGVQNVGTASRGAAGTRDSFQCCGVCEAQHPTCACLQCQFGLCDECRRTTHMKGRFREHEVVAVEQARRREQRYCPGHRGQLMDLYCQTCTSCVCVMCCFGGVHSGHAVVPLTEAAAEVGASLSRYASELQSWEKSASALQLELASLWPPYNKKVQEVRADIQHCFAALRQTLQDREDSLLACLDKASTAMQRKSRKLIANNEALMELLQCTTQHIGALHDAVDPPTLMNIADAVHRQRDWVSHLAATEMRCSTNAVEGWREGLERDNEAAPNTSGCRIAAFHLLGPHAPNDVGVFQYSQVLADLGMLRASEDIELLSHDSSVLSKSTPPHDGEAESPFSCESMTENKSPLSQRNTNSSPDSPDQLVRSSAESLFVDKGHVGYPPPDTPMELPREVAEAAPSVLPRTNATAAVAASCEGHRLTEPHFFTSVSHNRRCLSSDVELATSLKYAPLKRLQLNSSVDKDSDSTMSSDAKAIGQEQRLRTPPLRAPKLSIHTAVRDNISPSMGLSSTCSSQPFFVMSTPSQFSTERVAAATDVVKGRTASAPAMSEKATELPKRSGGLQLQF